MAWPTFYLICFVVGFAFSVLSLLGGIGRLHLHLPRHLHFPGRISLPGAPSGQAGAQNAGVAGRGVHAGRVSTARPAAGVHVSFFNFFSLMAFLAWFGGTGYILTTYSSVAALLALAIATVAGMSGAGVVFWFFARVLVAGERPLDPADYSLVGVLGRVSVSIRADGTGEIIFSQAGTRRTSGARSENGQAIAHGAEVVITGYERGIAYVRRWEDLTEDTGMRKMSEG